jgi:hypothetical protein
MAWVWVACVRGADVPGVMELAAGLRRFDPASRLCCLCLDQTAFSLLGLVRQPGLTLLDVGHLPGLEGEPPLLLTLDDPLGPHLAPLVLSGLLEVLDRVDGVCWCHPQVGLFASLEPWLEKARDVGLAVVGQVPREAPSLAAVARTPEGARALSRWARSPETSPGPGDGTALAGFDDQDRIDLSSRLSGPRLDGRLLAGFDFRMTRWIHPDYMLASGFSDQGFDLDLMRFLYRPRAQALAGHLDELSRLTADSDLARLFPMPGPGSLGPGTPVLARDKGAQPLAELGGVPVRLGRDWVLHCPPGPGRELGLACQGGDRGGPWPLDYLTGREHGRDLAWATMATAKADQARQRGEPGVARELCGQVLAEFHDHPAALLVLAKMDAAGGEYNLALARLRQALERDPHHREAVLEMLRIYRLACRCPDAEGAAAGWLDRYPDDVQVRRVLNDLQQARHARLASECARMEPVDGPGPCRVTVLVSTYASAGFISRCLKDLLAQTIRPEMEVVVVDADSPQDEMSVVADFQRDNPFIRYYRTPSRISVYQAWNLAITLARGRYLVPFSTNDRLLPHALETLCGVLDSDPDARLAFGDTWLTDRPHQEPGSHSPSPVDGGVWRWPDYSFAHNLENVCVGPHPMWRASVHAESGYFDERHPRVADQEFFLRLGRVGGLVHVPEITGLAWLDPASVSGRAGTGPEHERIRRVYRRIQAREALEAAVFSAPS